MTARPAWMPNSSALHSLPVCRFCKSANPEPQCSSPYAAYQDSCFASVELPPVAHRMPDGSAISAMDWDDEAGDCEPLGWRLSDFAGAAGLVMAIAFAIGVWG